MLTINGSSSRQAFENARGQRMDLVEVDLPSAFQQQTLRTIAITDTALCPSARHFVWGIGAVGMG
jgi:hypothetical protein